MALELSIVTPEGERFRGSVERVVLPGSEGDFGVLENHERFLTPLRIGGVEIVREGETIWAAIADGFADVSANEVSVMVDSCEMASDIDVARAELAQSRAEQNLSEPGVSEDEQRMLQYEAALSRARIRLEIGSKA